MSCACRAMQLYLCRHQLEIHFGAVVSCTHKPAVAVTELAHFGIPFHCSCLRLKLDQTRVHTFLQSYHCIAATCMGCMCNAHRQRFSIYNKRCRFPSSENTQLIFGPPTHLLRPGRAQASKFDQFRSQPQIGRLARDHEVPKLASESRLSNAV